MRRSLPFFLAAAPLALGAGWLGSADSAGQEPWHWELHELRAEEGFVVDRQTPRAVAAEPTTFAPAEFGGGAIFNDDAQVLTVAERAGELLDRLPRAAITVSALVAIESPQRWGGIVSCVQDNGGYEKGWVLGYDDECFTFGLATTGTDDGDGRMSYVRGTTPYQAGRWHHVVATFDGSFTCIFVDGQLDVESSLQHGELLYDADAPFLIGAYRDRDENYPHDGRIAQATVAAEAWSAEQVARQSGESDRRRGTPAWTDLSFGFLVEPFLTWPEQDAMSVNFETTFPSQAEVLVRHESVISEQAEATVSSSNSRLHNLRLTGLQADSKYFYRVRARSETGEMLESEWLSFRTAASPRKAFTFMVVGDTQSQPEVVRRVSDLMYMHRPNFLVHAGDLVSTGSSKRDWTHHFFPNMQPLIGRVPLMPVLGNHEQDAKHYYDYMDLPTPERWYSFTYGSAEFFMLDGNRALGDQSEQLQWLEQALSQSQARWRFAVLHQPPYTSDSDDYGDTFTGPSTRGDRNVQNIIALLEKYGVDICFSGHVHDYERTFPIRGNEVVTHERGGVIYITAAGGGGHLENFDPANTWFGHKKAQVHHLVYVAIHDDVLELQAVDEQGRLFDSLVLRDR